MTRERPGSRCCSEATVRRAALVAVLAVAAGCGKGKPKLEVTASWDDAYAMPGCHRHLLKLEVETRPDVWVRAAGVEQMSSSEGEASLELRRAALGDARTVRVSIEGAEREVAIPGRDRDASPVEIGVDSKAPPATPEVWSGAATGAVTSGKLHVVTGQLHGNDLRFVFTGCDLLGGSATGGTVLALGPDAIEVRFAIAPRLAAATSLAWIEDPLTFDVENADHVRGTVTLAGRLDVAEALAHGLARSSPDAAPWQEGQPNSIVVTGPGLTALPRADALLRGQPIGRAAGVLVLAITQVPSDKVCVGYQEAYHGLPQSAPTTKAKIAAQVIARTTGQVVAERAFESEAECPYSITTVDRHAATIAAGPPWADVLAWLEGLQPAAP